MSGLSRHPNTRTRRAARLPDRVACRSRSLVATAAEMGGCSLKDGLPGGAAPNGPIQWGITA
jgi:hypothetical protein